MTPHRLAWEVPTLRHRQRKHFARAQGVPCPRMYQRLLWRPLCQQGHSLLRRWRGFLRRQQRRFLMQRSCVTMHRSCRWRSREV